MPDTKNLEQILRELNGKDAGSLDSIEKEIKLNAEEAEEMNKTAAVKSSDFELTPKMAIGGAIAIALALFGLS